MIKSELFQILPIKSDGAKSYIIQWRRNSVDKFRYSFSTNTFNTEQAAQIYLDLALYEIIENYVGEYGWPDPKLLIKEKEK